MHRRGPTNFAAVPQTSPPTPAAAAGPSTWLGGHRVAIDCCLSDDNKERINSAATKDDESDSFKHYCGLRDGNSCTMGDCAASPRSSGWTSRYSRARRLNVAREIRETLTRPVAFRRCLTSLSAACFARTSIQMWCSRDRIALAIAIFLPFIVMVRSTGLSVARWSVLRSILTDHRALRI
jgi:hypothetical protein